MMMKIYEKDEVRSLELSNSNLNESANYLHIANI